MITQAELARYLELRRAEDRASSALITAKLALMDRHREDVEPGPYTLTIEDRRSKRFCYIELVGLLGKPAADDLKERLPVCVTTVVLVTGPTEPK